MDSAEPPELLLLLVPDVNVGVVAKFLELLYVGTTTMEDPSEFDQMKEFCNAQLGFFMLLNWNIQIEKKTSCLVRPTSDLNLERKLSALQSNLIVSSEKSFPRKRQHSFIETLEKQIERCKAILTSKPIPVQDFQRESSSNCERTSSAIDMESVTSHVTIKDDDDDVIGMEEKFEASMDDSFLQDDLIETKDDPLDVDSEPGHPLKEVPGLENQPINAIQKNGKKMKVAKALNRKRKQETKEINSKRSRGTNPTAISPVLQEGHDVTTEKCNSCGKSYPPFYFPNHRCKGPPRYEVLLTCHLCNTTFNVKSNIIRHYLKIHKVVRLKIPETILKAKGEMKKPKMCHVCRRSFSNLSRHLCRK